MRNERGSEGKIKQGLNLKAQALKAIEFIQKSLPEWRDDPSRKDEQAENRLNLQLCKYLESRSRSHFPMIQFNHEEYQEGRRSVDLSITPSQSIILEANVYSIYDPILIIECKRFPSPTKDREREYVTTGKSLTSSGNPVIGGGIQRFKMNFYAPTHELAAMIAYVQSNTFNQCLEKINKWIEELAQNCESDFCSWSQDEKLNFVSRENSKNIARCRSCHSREDSRKIELIHLWIMMR